ncbi:MAG: tRNA (adenosine(37)-N6)-dimethylallyltransferase MiaA, partial [Clostridia bacterium]|nr:tRNA (adenosine(37)-N6)-dimethylallyltransferase MiaA [Clostridia bacterium]
MDRNTCWVLTGPTASGKTALSIRLAKEHDCEIVCMDSMQIYKRMNIGTAKPTLEEMAGILHHMLDVAEPDENFSVARYQEMAEECIADIHARGKRALLVGGTGLYLRALRQPMA